MRELIFPVDHKSDVSLQAQVKRNLVDAILDGRIALSEPLPSCRRLSQSLGVSRNTVVLAYQAMLDDGFLISRERVGYFVNPDVPAENKSSAGALADQAAQAQSSSARKLQRRRLRVWPSELRALNKPKNWRSYPYPFVYGQTDPTIFPVAAWRHCSRQALSLDAIRNWSDDLFDADDPLLIEEIRTRVLPRRGIRASKDEILITMGAQNALYLVARLISAGGCRIGFEEPGYVDARNIFALAGGELRPLPIDDKGLIVDGRLSGCDFVYVTPSHQSPTTVTLPLDRRVALLEAAKKQDFYVIEDDYEAETNYISSPTSALKSMDRDNSVIYIGSFSKSLAPGLRLGYLVASPDIVTELRALRRYVLRHPPLNNQRTVYYFISGGYYESLILKMQRLYRQRWQAMGDALAKYLPETSHTPSFGGTSFWVKGPESLDAEELHAKALEKGILMEPGHLFFISSNAPKNFFRVSFSSVTKEKIEPGIRLLAELAHALT